MDIQDNWEKALKNTEIIRMRLRDLSTSGSTDLPYVFLAESSMNLGDTVVRKGKIAIEKPSLVIPTGLPQFEGFDFEKEMHLNEDTLINFFLVRGVTFPSFKYDNKTDSLDIYEGNLSKAIKYYSDKLQKEEDVSVGLIKGTEENWQFSVLIFICTQVAKSADNDIRRLMEDFRRKHRN